MKVYCSEIVVTFVPFQFHRYLPSSIYIQNRYYLLRCSMYINFSKVGGTITKIHIHESVFGVPGGMALDPWPLW